MDIPGVSNQRRRPLSSTSETESLHGFLTQAMTRQQIDQTVKAFADGAWRAQQAGLDGVELHGANGYLITQFLSSGINDRTDEYGGELANRARFLLDIIRAIRDRCGSKFHLQVKFNAVDHNNVIPWKKKGNTIEEGVQLAKWIEEAGADALHISVGSLFPHPLNPPGGFDFETITSTYDAMLSSGTYTLRNYFLFRYTLLRPIFHWIWFRLKPDVVEGISIDNCRQIKQAVKIPVICTGGFQTASFIAKCISENSCDGVSIARSLIANNDLVKQWQAGHDLPEKPCTHCNKCLLNDIKNPLGCYELDRFGGDYDKMIETVYSIYQTRPELQIPNP
jgi:2,4-dienoyl-CoA reductase-like NADH-dependent reductase (Old Yellow Enzyme family)